MTDFFDSDIVREEIEEINELQKSVYGNVMEFASLDRDEQLEHVDKLTELLEKQRIMYTRLSLSDDPKAVEMKKNIEQSVVIMGFPAGTDIGVLFDGMQKTINNLKDNVDSVDT